MTRIVERSFAWLGRKPRLSKVKIGPPVGAVECCPAALGGRLQVQPGVDTLGTVVARRMEASIVSDRRMGARLLTGLSFSVISLPIVPNGQPRVMRNLFCSSMLDKNHGPNLARI